MESTGYRIPLGGGRSRSVLVRPTERDVVQLGILSVYGNVLEAVDLDREIHGALVAALWLAREDADRLLLRRLTEAHADDRRRLAAALEANPHVAPLLEEVIA